MTHDSTAENADAPRLLLGINTFVWRSPLTTANLVTTLENIAALGYEAVELALENLDDWDANLAAETLGRLNLTSVVGGVFGPGRELAAASQNTIDQTKSYVRGAIDVAVRQGSPMVIGPLYTSVGRTWRMDPDERNRSLLQLRESLRDLTDYAGNSGIKLAIEPLNRYETSLLNTAEQVLDVIEPLPTEAIGLNLDTYHMNIEEKSIEGTIVASGERLLHLQVSGNDRGAPGEDHINWAAIRSALRQVGYSGVVGFESFTSDNDTIAVAASIWRSFAPTQDDLASKTITFLRDWRG